VDRATATGSRAGEPLDTEHAVAGSWAAPRWPFGVSGAEAGRAAMDAGHVADVTGRARRRQPRDAPPVCIRYVQKAHSFGTLSAYEVRVSHTGDGDPVNACDDQIGDALAGDYQKISVNMSKEVLEVLRETASRNNVTMTEILRRALSSWQIIDEAQREGKAILIRDPATKETERIIFHY